MKRTLAALAVVSFGATGCAVTGTLDEPGWIAVRDVPLVRQQAETDCGAAALAMVLAHWGSPASVADVTARCPVEADGIKAAALRDAARERGLKCFVIAGERADLERELGKGRPVLVGLFKTAGGRAVAHYEVVVGIHPELRRVALLDPARGPREESWEDFSEEWTRAARVTLVLFKAD